MDFKRLIEDIDAFMARDPAARTRIEVAILYQGFHAVLFYRISRALWVRGWRFGGRLISQAGRFLTGIEIHPGADIGRRFVIDHGSGVVIGETAVIGDDVTLYHDVTLGGVSPSVDSHEQVGVKRHPTLEDDVIVGCGASILGDITVGEGSRIGANAVVAKDIPPGVTAVGNPANVVMPKDKTKQREFRQYGTSEDGIPDPVLQTIESLRAQVTQLMGRVEELESDLRDARVGAGDAKRKDDDGSQTGSAA